MTDTISTSDRAHAEAKADLEARPTGSSPVGRAAATVRDRCLDSGIDGATLASLLRDRDDTALVPAASFCYDRTVPRPSIRQMRLLVAAVEEILCLDTPLDVNLAGVPTRILNGLRNLLSGVVFVGCVWLVVGGILTGATGMAQHEPPVATLIVLVVSLAGLALLEAAHLGAVALSNANVSEMRDAYPRLVRMHPLIATKDRLEHYLAGRQTGVVLVVFAVAEVTRTAGLRTLPWTDVALPWFLEIPLSMGMPGALMVLVVGQVAPQLLTARRPAAMMNTLPMYLAFTATVHVGQLGLATPAKWLVAWSTAVERIGSAAAVRHTATTRDVTGYGTDVIRRKTVVGAGGSRSTTVVSTAFYKGGMTMHPVDIASTPVPPRATDLRTRLRRSGGGSEPITVISGTTTTVDDRGAHLFSETFAPRLGVFQEGDVLRTSFVAEYAAALEEDLVVVTTPTRLVVVHVVLEHPTTPMPPAVLTLREPGAVSGPLVRTLMPSMDEADGSIEFLAALRYPTVGSRIQLSWGPEVDR